MHLDSWSLLLYQKIKKKKAPKWPAPRKCCKKHRTLPAPNDITFRILLRKGKMLLGANNILLGRDRRREQETEGC